MDKKAMRHELRDLMRETVLPVNQIVAATGVSPRWWYDYLNQATKDTKTERAEKLIAYLKKHRPRKRRLIK